MLKPRVLYFVEGFTDIRFVVGLAEISELTLCTPSKHYTDSGLKNRVRDSGVSLVVHEIAGNRLAFQWRSLRWLWRHIHEFDVVLSQEMLRGSLNATVVGALRGVPVLTTLLLSPLEYFRCRRERGQISLAKSWAIECVIRCLMTINGRLCSRCLALGPYLRQVGQGYCDNTVNGAYYGVDTSFFTPANDDDRRALRVKRDLPVNRFVVLLASRISHEKDPETVLRAAALARTRGLDLVLLNLGGGYKEFLQLADQLGIEDAGHWIIGRPAAHPMTEVADYFRAVDLVAQASLAEGLGLSTLEALACGTPVAATAVGGMALALRGLARLSPRRDHEAMATEFLWVAAHPREARAQALLGREHVVAEWSREKAFGDLGGVIASVVPNRTPLEAIAANERVR